MNAVKAGNYIETAAAWAGISKDTLYNWLKKGARSRRGKFRAFAEAMEKAQAEAEMRDIQTIGQAALSGNWQASAWRLERKFPKKWGRVDRSEVTGKDGGPVEVKGEVTGSEHAELVADSLLRLAERLLVPKTEGDAERAGGADPASQDGTVASE